MDIVRILRYVSIAEATSFLLLLLVAMPLKYGADTPQAVQVMGPIHGVLFLAYVGLVLMVRGQLGWDIKRTVLALIAAVLPVAPYFVERFWLKQAPQPEAVRA
ncbi:DUF3817 domain-containing protein [Actinomadura barringtoniae]|uniref:DUF3817 domain-containing protein n=1 Tax=Actinomadura barringtoniae TaxID=1427535 RepID=A0A939T9M4_9ACTN|nr:DUF3817 domain-containing protein [Actinomadura barringtoniae]MBO2448120.1 DUF3817 domain-containing protein [Actinomadura barringtoniae]